MSALCWYGKTETRKKKSGAARPEYALGAHTGEPAISITPGLIKSKTALIEAKHARQCALPVRCRSIPIYTQALTDRRFTRASLVWAAAVSSLASYQSVAHTVRR